MSVRVQIPAPLRRLTGADAEVALDVAAPVTIDSVLDALESKYPGLKGTIRDHVTGSGAPSYGSLPSRKTSRTIRRTRRFRMRWRGGRSRWWSSARSPAAEPPFPLDVTFVAPPERDAGGEAQTG